MDTKTKIRQYREEILQHQQQSSLYLSILNNERGALYIGQMPPNIVKLPLYGLIFPDDPHYPALKKVIGELSQYHYSRYLHLELQVKMLEESLQVT